MKIKLLIDIPVGKKHNLKSGQIHEVLETYKSIGRGDYNGYWITGNGERVKVWAHECEVVK